jgi:GDP/UDP-N,N'-diacetylbacillosamine 2-epimerase (hydrolysing)
MKKQPIERRICFVTGTRAEFGLMERTLGAIQKHPKLELQLIATGMHLNLAYGRPLSLIQRAGFKVDARIPWSTTSGNSAAQTAQATGQAIALLASAFKRLKPHIILIVGDRVEAFAAASAAHISQLPIAHVHGGDRALGEIDDSLRHAISKLAHIHFPATKQSANRLLKMGEDRFRIYPVGSPGIDGIHELSAAPAQFTGRFALVVHHPVSPDILMERIHAYGIVCAMFKTNFDPIVFFQPNNDPGCEQIKQVWKRYREHPRIRLQSGLPRSDFLSLLRRAAVLVGNSSSGIIEAASFGTPVINIGDRQLGRERNANVIDVPDRLAQIVQALEKVWNNGRPIRFPKKNIYGSGRTSEKIAHILATIPLDARLRRKLIAY